MYIVMKQEGIGGLFFDYLKATATSVDGRF